MEPQTQTRFIGQITIFYCDQGHPTPQAEDGVKTLADALENATNGAASTADMNLVRVFSKTAADLFPIRPLSNKELPCYLRNRTRVVGFAPKHA